MTAVLCYALWGGKAGEAAVAYGRAAVAHAPPSIGALMGYSRRERLFARTAGSAAVGTNLRVDPRVLKIQAPSPTSSNSAAVSATPAPTPTPACSAR
jgi:hypothetical protein